MKEKFRQFSQNCAIAVGSPIAFLFAGLIIVAWALTGPLFHYSDTWQLVINTGTGLITFLMVFVIQSSQNRDSVVMQLKLDELLRALKEARTSMVHLEQWADEDLDQLKREFERISKARS